MPRFTTTIESLRAQRRALLEESKKKRKRKSSERKKSVSLSFDSPELERIFNSLPEDMKGMLKEI